MKRNTHILLLGLLAILVAVGWTSLGQPEMEELEPFLGHIRSDLQLISQESKPEWSPRWTGPIQAATILAWMYEHGYSEFLRDFNDDGEIDELDTIELADIFGNGLMRTETPVGTNDARLVIGLARYVADLYPGEFVLKIYDEGFPAEFNAEGDAQFSEFAIPGIELRLMTEPTIEAYEFEMESSEGVIVGLEEGEGRNTYLSGRSFLYEETPAGYTPVDFAWAEEDRFEPETQGRVLETVAMMDELLYVDYRMGWTLAEFMIALSPVNPYEFRSMRYNCPDDAIAYHVTTNTSRYGTVEVEECVLREGDVDIYYWIVHNIDFIYDGCGICTFGVSNGGLHAVGHYGPMMWPFMETPGAWFWRAPFGSCGFMPGQTAVFMVAVPGPTVDAWVPAAVQGCVWGLSFENPIGPIRTTGPISIDLEDCPDIELEVYDHGCTTLPDGGLRITVSPLTVRNVGGADVTDGFSVTAFAPGYSGSSSVFVPAPLAAGAFIDLPALVFVIPPAEAPDPACPITIRVVADSSFAVDECSESNNTVEFEECCPGEPGDSRGACCYPDGTCAEMGEADCLADGGTYEGAGTTCATVECPEDGDGCPDLTAKILRVSCDCGGAVGQGGPYEGTVYIRVENIGDAASPPITDGLELNTGAEFNVPGLAPGSHVDFSFDFSGTARLCDEIAIHFTAEVDPDDDVDECSEMNNTDSYDGGC